ncbi:hypothetical protein [Variovorax sp. YR566]|uniref:hypothetical protein n=1 Tax=Variovorax sp. YR566 TaxID=3450237 RepID=UPI003F7E8209
MGSLGSRPPLQTKEINSFKSRTIMTFGKQFRRDARAAERQQRKWADRLHRDFLRRQRAFVVPRAHEEHLNQQGLLEAVARPDPLLQAPPQRQAQVLPQPVPPPRLDQAQAPVAVLMPTAMPVPIPQPVQMPVPVPILAQAEPSQGQTSAPRQFKMNPNAAAYTPPPKTNNVLLSPQKQEDEKLFKDEFDFTTNFGANLQALMSRCADLNSRAIALTPNSDVDGQDYKHFGNWLLWFEGYCRNGLIHVGSCLKTLEDLSGWRGELSVQIVESMLSYLPEFDLTERDFHIFSDLIVVGEETAKLKLLYPRLGLNAFVVSCETGPINILSTSQLQTLNKKLDGTVVLKWAFESVPYTRRNTAFNNPVAGKILMPKELKDFQYQLGGEVFCDWISHSQDHAPSILEVKRVFEWARRPENSKGPNGFVETSNNKGNISLDHPNSSYKFVVNSGRTLLITAYK